MNNDLERSYFPQDREYQKPTAMELADIFDHARMREALEQHTNRSREELIDQYIPRFRVMVEALGKEQATVMLQEVFAHNSPRATHEAMTAFSGSCWEDAVDFFGENIAQKYLAEGQVDLFVFGLEELENLADALGDDTPDHKKTLEFLTTESFGNRHIWRRDEVVAFMKEAQGFMSEEEFDILVHGEARKFFFVRRSPNQDFVFKNAEQRWETWKEIFGDRWLDLLRAGADVSAISPKIEQLEVLSSIIPNFKNRLLPEGEDIMVAFDRVNTLGAALFFRPNMPEESRSFFERLPKDERDIILHRSLEDIVLFLKWISGDVGKMMWGAFKGACSSAYARAVLHEPVFISRYMAPLADRAGYMEDSPSPLVNRDVYSKFFEQRERIDDMLSETEFTKQLLVDRPEIAPFLRLRHGDRGVSAEELEQYAGELAGVSAKEFDSRFVPSVGSEVEITEEAKFSHNKMPDYIKSAVFGIVDSVDESWEFSLDASPVPTQARFIAELIDQDLLDERQMEGGKYTLHCNVGILEGVVVDEDRIGLVAHALTAAYASDERIREGEYRDVFSVNTPGAEKKRAGRSEAQEHVAGQRYVGRLEMRALSVERHTIYRLLYDAAMVASAFFANQRDEPRGEKDEQLKALWLEFENAVLPLFRQVGIAWETPHVAKKMNLQINLPRFSRILKNWFEN